MSLCISNDTDSLYDGVYRDDPEDNRSQEA